MNISQDPVNGLTEAKNLYRLLTLCNRSPAVLLCKKPLTAR